MLFTLFSLMSVPNLIHLLESTGVEDDVQLEILHSYIVTSAENVYVQVAGYMLRHNNMEEEIVANYAKHINDIKEIADIYGFDDDLTYAESLVNGIDKITLHDAISAKIRYIMSDAKFTYLMRKYYEHEDIDVNKFLMSLTREMNLISLGYEGLISRLVNNFRKYILIY